MTPEPDGLRQVERELLVWLQQEEQQGQEGVARSTLAGVLVILDKLRGHCPLIAADVFTRGGQISGARGGALRQVLERHGIEPDRFLADGVTTRSAEKFRLLLEAWEWGRPLVALTDEERDGAVAKLEAIINAKVVEWLARQRLRVTAERGLSPVAWVRALLDSAHGRSGGRVEQHLVGAKLEFRLPELEVTRHAATAGDAQTDRPGDFAVGESALHVTAAPSESVIRRCIENARQGLIPVLLVPSEKIDGARMLADNAGEGDRIAILGIEEFIAQNIIEIAVERGMSFFEVLDGIVARYNERIEQSETDQSLRIDLE